jgi:prepilin-type N-terminal cleavage/methylation domain-containing protein
MANVKGMTKQSVIRYIVTSLQRIYGSTTQRFNDLTWRSRSSLSARGAFTLIELIVVVTVIVILTGLVLSTVGYVQKKAARSRAETEIAAMAAALESYKADNGIYAFNSATNTLDARTNIDPSSYPSASLLLYEQLAGDSAHNRQPSGKSYFTFKPKMLYPDDQTQNVQYIRDPFGNSYGYSTAGNPQVNPTPAGTPGYNPTFDLWSTAGVAPSPTPVPPTRQQDLWIKNW